MTPSLTMDPPHVVHTGVACMACCAVAPGKLLRCGGCDSAWYCNVDCQRKNFKEHKPMCKALRLFHALQADLSPETWPRTAGDFYMQRSNCQRILEPMLRRPLSRAEHRAILGEAKCSVCMRTRSQLAAQAARAPAAATIAAAAATKTPSPSPSTLSSSTSSVSSLSSSSAPAPTAGAPGGDLEKIGEAPAHAHAPGQPGDAAKTSSTGADAPAAGPAGAEAKSGSPANGSSVSTSGPVGAVAAVADGPRPATAGPGLGEVAAKAADAAAGGEATVPKAAADTPTNTDTDANNIATGNNYPNNIDTKTASNTTAAGATSGPSAATAPATLSCCPHCHWGWGCSEHRDGYLSGPHASVCMSYQNMNESQLLTYRYLTATGRLPNYVPDKLRPAGLPPGVLAVWEPVPAGWPAYQGWRPLPAFDHAMMCLLTKRMSQALTVVQALQHHYTPQQLAAKSRLEVHVLGASAFEVPADRIWEEILNLLPPWQAPPDAGTTAAAGAEAAAPSSPPRVLHVAFVGPELVDIIIEESDGRALAQGSALSSPPPPPGRELLYSYHLCTYQEFARGRRRTAGGPGPTECPWQRPDLAVAFNSGMSESDQQLWAPALEVLVRHDVPVVFTSYNADEAAADAAVWRRAGGAVSLGPERNPFRALEPIAEPSMVDAFYYQNYHWWCGRAAAGKAPVG